MFTKGYDAHGLALRVAIGIALSGALKLKCFGSKALKECVLQLDNHAAILSCFV
ncbi:MAG: hypothetical protein V7L20_13730 [Nostoc sp.]